MNTYYRIYLNVNNSDITDLYIILDSLDKHGCPQGKILKINSLTSGDEGYYVGMVHEFWHEYAYKVTKPEIINELDKLMVFE